MIGLSSHALDMIATELSAFTDPDIPELSLHDDKTLQNNMLASVLGAFGGPGNAPVRHLMTNIVRRVYASIETYRLGRTHALDYVNGDRNGRISPYFLALTFFETCVSYSWQVADFVRSGQKLFTPGDASAWERMHSIYTVGTKHSAGQYDDGAKPEMPTTVWLTNSGLSCVSGAELRYQELAEIIADSNKLFYEVQERALAKRRATPSV